MPWHPTARQRVLYGQRDRAQNNSYRAWLGDSQTQGSGDDDQIDHQGVMQVVQQFRHESARFRPEVLALKLRLNSFNQIVKNSPHAVL